MNPYFSDTQFVCVYICMYVYILHIFVCLYVDACVCMYVYICMCVYVCLFLGDRRDHQERGEEKEGAEAWMRNNLNIHKLENK